MRGRRGVPVASCIPVPASRHSRAERARRGDHEQPASAGPRRPGSGRAAAPASGPPGRPGRAAGAAGSAAPVAATTMTAPSAITNHRVSANSGSRSVEASAQATAVVTVIRCSRSCPVTPVDGRSRPVHRTVQPLPGGRERGARAGHRDPPARRRKISAVRAVASASPPAAQAETARSSASAGAFRPARGQLTGLVGGQPARRPRSAAAAPGQRRRSPGEVGGAATG